MTARPEFVPYLRQWARQRLDGFHHLHPWHLALYAGIVAAFASVLVGLLAAIGASFGGLAVVVAVLALLMVAANLFLPSRQRISKRRSGHRH